MKILIGLKTIDKNILSVNRDTLRIILNIMMMMMLTK